MFIRRLHPLRHALACAALAASMSVYCDVAPAQNVPERTIHYRPAELATDTGVQELYRKLQRASREICDDLLGSHRKNTHQHRMCYARVLADAVAKVDRPALTSLQEQRGVKETRHSRRVAKSAS